MSDAPPPSARRRVVLATITAAACAAGILAAGGTLAAPAAAHSGAGAPRVHALVTLPPGTAVPATLARDVARWRADGLVARATWLDALPPAADSAETPGFSTLLVLDFADEAALRAWRSRAALAPPFVVRPADAVVRGTGAGFDPAAATYEVNVYRLETTPDEYRRFCEGYIVPLMEGQRAGGLMGDWTMYVERASGGAAARSFLVKQYRDAAAYRDAAEFKPKLRERLTATHPTYPKYHATKERLRDDESETVARLRPAPPPAPPAAPAR